MYETTRTALPAPTGAGAGVIVDAIENRPQAERNAAPPQGSTPPASREETCKNQQPPKQQRPAPWKFQRITVDEFRRRYFFVDNRPTRASVKRWIESGTAEGKILQGYLIDGKYYITITAAERFIDELRVRVRTAMTTPKAAAQIRERRTAQALREIGFSFM